MGPFYIDSEFIDSNNKRIIEYREKLFPKISK